MKLTEEENSRLLDLIRLIAEKEKESLDKQTPSEEKLKGESKELEKEFEEDLAKEGKREKLLNQKQERELRKEYVDKLFWLLVIWLTMVIYIIILDAFSVKIFDFIKFELSDAVLITLITTTTGNVAVLFYIVTKHLFPKGKD